MYDISLLQRAWSFWAGIYPGYPLWMPLWKSSWSQMYYSTGIIRRERALRRSRNLFRKLQCYNITMSQSQWPSSVMQAEMGLEQCCYKTTNLCVMHLVHELTPRWGMHQFTNWIWNVSSCLWLSQVPSVHLWQKCGSWNGSQAAAGDKFQTIVTSMWSSMYVDMMWRYETSLVVGNSWQTPWVDHLWRMMSTKLMKNSKN